MQALVYHGPRQLQIESVADPQCGSGDVLIRVRASGICGSDLHGYLGISGRRIPPMIMGHEFAGEVVAVGAGVQYLSVGDRVAVQPMLFCGECEMCRQGLTTRCAHRKMLGVMDVNGSMAELISVPGRLVYKLPDSVDDIHGALLEPLAVAYSAVSRVVGADARHTLVVGAGTIGLLVVQVLRAKFPQMAILVSDTNVHRLGLAKEMGADHTLVAQADEVETGVKTATSGEGVDLSFEAVGISATVQQALGNLRSGGTCVWIGNSAKVIDLNMQDVVTRELTIRGTYAYTHAAFGEALKMLESGRLNLDPVVSRVCRLAEGPEMFEKLVLGTDDLVKVVLKI